MYLPELLDAGLKDALKERLYSAMRSCYHCEDQQQSVLTLRVQLRLHEEGIRLSIFVHPCSPEAR